MTKTVDKLRSLIEDPETRMVERMVMAEALALLSKPAHECEPPHCSTCACGVQAEFHNPADVHALGIVVADPGVPARVKSVAQLALSGGAAALELL